MPLAAFNRMRREKKNKERITRGNDVPIDSILPRSIAELSIKELREMCKKQGLKGYSNKSEAELIEMLEGGVKNVETNS